MANYVWLVPFLPLAGFLINGVIGVRFPKKVIGPLASLAVGGSFVVSLLLLRDLLGLPPHERTIEHLFFTWIPCGELNVPLGFLVDPLSVVMMLTVSGVSFIIHVYSIGYMHDDPGYRRYFAYLNLFVFFMLILVSSNGFLTMFVGWEGVGLCSYLLIGFWYERKAPADAGKKAFVVNRVGDYGFLLAMMLIFVTFQSLEFTKVFGAAESYPSGHITITLITLLLFVGACGKSAQLPLYVWLPDAMEGPTPVSALIHAATMVTAGVYMVARCHVLYALAPLSLNVVAIVGGVTALFAASIGLVQNDIKRVLAYSTISQLGYMFLACGVGAFVSGIFHLMTHAFFKALLFLGAGSVMHALSGELNMQKMGALRKKLPATYMTFLIATLAISGLPPFAGFFSKDEILFAAFNRSLFLWALGAFAAILTAFYMFRALFLTFFGESRVDPGVHPHESPRVMTIPLALLAVLSLIGGWINVPIIHGLNRFTSFLSPVFGGEEGGGHHAEVGLEVTLMVVSVGIALCGILIAWYMYRRNLEAPTKLGATFPVPYRVLFNKYYVDELYDFVIVEPIRRTSEGFLWLTFDNKVVDGMVNGAGWITERISAALKRVQTGYVQNYALSMAIGAILLLYYLLS